MRVLVANKFWYRRGGLERVMFDEIAMLEAHGHEVAHFSTTHPLNVRSPWSDYFVEYLGLGPGESSGVSEKLAATARMFYNAAARREFGRLLADFAPDVVHVHGIHRQISPSILREATGGHIPVLQTLHDYHHVCPADTLLRGGSAVCRPARCTAYNCLPAVSGRCLRGSRAVSALSASETVWQRATGAYSAKSVSLFVCPSRFMAEMMVAGGWDSERLRVIPNSCIVTGRVDVESRGRLLLASRLVPEKGVEVALAAAERAGVGIDVAGEGPERTRLEPLFPHARFLGRLSGGEMDRLTPQALAMVVPSLWLENAPMSILESMAAGVPVVASGIGGIGEQIRDGVDGFLCEPGDIESFSSAIGRLAANPPLARRMGGAARERVATMFSPEVHFDSLMSAYRSVGARP